MGEGDFSNGLTYKRHQNRIYTIFHGMVYFPDPVGDIRNPLNKSFL
jgi:hypothetical protein